MKIERINFGCLGGRGGGPPLVAFEEVEIRLNGTNICQTHQHPRIIIIIIVIIIIIIIL